MWKPAAGVSWSSGRRVALCSSSQGKGWHRGGRAGVSHEELLEQVLLASQSHGSHSGKLLPFSGDSHPYPGDGPWAGTQFPALLPVEQPLPAVCPLIHEQGWQSPPPPLYRPNRNIWRKKIRLHANTNINLFSPPRSQVVLLQGTLMVSISIDSFSAYINPKFPLLFFLHAAITPTPWSDSPFNWFANRGPDVPVNNNKNLLSHCTCFSQRWENLW